MNSNISKYLIYFFLDLWPDMSFPGCCRNFLFSWRNPRSIFGSGVNSKEICWRMWKRWVNRARGRHVERGGGKGQRRGHSPLPPPPFPLFAQATQGRECIVRMLSTLVYICFVRAGGGGWFRVILEHNWTQRSDLVFQVKGFVIGDITFNSPSLPAWLFYSFPVILYYRKRKLFKTKLSKAEKTILCIDRGDAFISQLLMLVMRPELSCDQLVTHAQRHVIIFLSSSFSSSCFHLVYCPYDTESILMIALISVLILQAAIALSGVIESSQLLCCTVEVSVRVC